MDIVEKTNDEGIKKQVREFLERHYKMIFTVLDKEKHPNSSLMLYVVDDELNFYFGTCECFGKYDAVKNDPHVSAAVVHEAVDPLQVVDIQGEAEEIPKEKTKETLDWFCSKNPAKFYVKDAKDFVMFKIKPSGLRWLDATGGGLKIYDLELG